MWSRCSLSRRLDAIFLERSTNAANASPSTSTRYISFQPIAWSSSSDRNFADRLLITSTTAPGNIFLITVSANYL